MLQTHVEDYFLAMEEIASSALLLWGFTSGSHYRLLNHTENTTYLITDAIDENKKSVLRIHRKDYHSLDGILSEHLWMEQLRRDNIIETPEIIKNVNGNNIEKIYCDKLKEMRYCVMFKFIEGDNPSEDDLLKPFFELGKISAKMHEHVIEWQRPLTFERQLWDYEHSLGDNPNWGDWRNGMDLNKANTELLARACDKTKQRLDSFGMHPLRFNLIHSDIRIANLLVHKSHKPCVIDFDDCGFGWFLYDLASALSFMEGRLDLKELINSWLLGYMNFRKLNIEEINEIPTFLMLRRMIILAWIGSHTETELAQSLGLEYTLKTEELALIYLEDMNKLYSYDDFENASKKLL